MFQHFKTSIEQYMIWDMCLFILVYWKNIAKLYYQWPSKRFENYWKSHWLIWLQCSEILISKIDTEMLHQNTCDFKEMLSTMYHNTRQCPYLICLGIWRLGTVSFNSLPLLTLCTTRTSLTTVIFVQFWSWAVTIHHKAPVIFFTK